MDEQKYYQSDDLSAESMQEACGVRVISFKPSFKHQQLRIYENHTKDSKLKVIFKRQTLLLCIKTCGTDWWYLRYDQIYGWAHVTHEMLSLKVFSSDLVSMHNL